MIRIVVGVLWLHLAIYGGLLIVVMLYFPGGIAAALARFAARRGKEMP